MLKWSSRFSDGRPWVLGKWFKGENIRFYICQVFIYKAVLSGLFSLKEWTYYVHFSPRQNIIFINFRFVIKKKNTTEFWDKFSCKTFNKICENSGSINLSKKKRNFFLSILKSQRYLCNFVISELWRILYKFFLVS